MTTVTREEARKRFDELLAELPAAGTIDITDAGKVVATLTAGALMSPGQGPHSVLDIKPHSCGGLLRPYPDTNDDILEEMLEDKLDKAFPRLDPK